MHATNELALGVNIDHIAVLREARRVNDPNPLLAVGICAQNGADQITIHLREDRRHIQDDDVKRIIAESPIQVNIECSIDENIVDIICMYKPHRVTLVPEQRKELTTEGGLDVGNNFQAVVDAVKRFQENDIAVSLFVEPTLETIEHCYKTGAQMVELHTGAYANIFAMLNSNLARTNGKIEEYDLPREELAAMMERSLQLIDESAKRAKEIDMIVAAGHGLNYHNVRQIVAIPEISELNIGQSIIARSVFTGIGQAVKDMKALCQR